MEASVKVELALLPGSVDDAEVDPLLVAQVAALLQGNGRLGLEPPAKDARQVLGFAAVGAPVLAGGKAAAFLNRVLRRLAGGGGQGEGGGGHEGEDDGGETHFVIIGLSLREP